MRVTDLQGKTINISKANYEYMKASAYQRGVYGLPLDFKYTFQEEYYNKGAQDADRSKDESI